MLTPGPSSSELPFPLPFPPVLSCIMDFTSVASNVFFFPFCFTGVFLKIVFMIDVWFFLDLFVQYCRFYFNLLHQLCMFAFLTAMRFSAPLFPGIFLINLFALDYFFVCSLNLLHQLCLFSFLS